MTYQFI